MRKFLFLRHLLPLLFFCISILKGYSQTIAAWDFTGEGTVSTVTTSAADVYDANLDASNLLTRGSGASWSTGSNSFRTVGFKNDGIATTNTDYFQFTLSSVAGYLLSISTIDAKFAGTGTFAASPGVSSQFAYSLDGTNFTLIGTPSITIGTPATLTQINTSSITALQNLPASTTVTFRYYASGQTATGGWGFNSSSLGTYGLAIGGSFAVVNPTPTTTSIAPANANAGSSGFTLTVNGTNFINGASTVTWNGANRTTTFVSSTQLTATIPSSDLLTAGTANVGVTTTGAASVSNTQIFTINPAVGASLSLTSPITSFGNVCINTTTAANSFTIDGNNLDGSNISIAALPGFSYCETIGGTYTNTLSFSYTGNSFTGKIIYVIFNPTAVQTYNGTINISGGGLSAAYPITVTGGGVNTTPSVTTNTATSIAATSANVSGTITNNGCASITAYGIEYSTSSGFPNGSGTPINASNLSGGNFSVSLSSLLPNTRYYYHAFATNSVGTSYGAQQAFNANPLPVPMASQPSLTFTETFADIANWDNFFINGVGSNHWDGLSTTATAPAAGIPNPTIITAQTNTFQLPSGGTPSQTGGVQKGTDQTVPTQSIVLLSTGTTNNTSSAAIDLYVDFTGVNAGTLSFDYAEVNNGTPTDNRPGSLRVYYSTNGTSFTELTNVLNFSNNVSLSGSKSNIPLPAALNNAPNTLFRFYYYNGETGGTTGSRPKLSIDNVKITALANIPCTAPAAPATNLTFGPITDVSIQGNFTSAIPAVDGYIVVMSSNSSLTANPTDGQIYNIGDNLGDGTVIANASATTFMATGLTALSTYYFFVFPVNSVCTGGPLYYSTTILNGAASTIAGLPSCIAPTSQPTNLVFGSTSTNSIQGSFTPTSANEYLVLRSTSASLSNNPIDTHIYNTGDIIGNAVVVQKSAATTFTTNGLQPATPYYFFVFSLNNQGCVNGPAYNTTNPLVSSQNTLPLPPCATPLLQPTSLILTASNSAIAGTFASTANADNYIVVQSLSPTLLALPVDNTDYNLGDSLGGGTVVANTSNTSFASSQLTANTPYYYYVFASNKNCSGGTKYLTANPLTGNIVTSGIIANNIYFGTLHSHSDYSDGNKDNPGYTPADDYNYAMTAQCMDYLGISEHNHFSSPDNPGNSINTYHLGIAQANNFTSTHPNFLALYGMEWGVISGGGHVVVYGNGMDNLWGWESGSGGWGATNNYDVYVPKSVYTGSTGLFKTVNDNIATNTFATLAHPNLTDFNNLAGTAYDAVADNAITGCAVESGPATSTNTTYSDPGSSLSYLWYYQTLLSKGYHLGPTIDHDNHNTTFGKTTTSRTAIIAPSLTKAAIVNAMRNMNFYATQDCDSKVDFTINTKIMGSVFTDRFAPNISVNFSDATNTLAPIGLGTTVIIRVMFGVPGSGVLPVKIDSVIGYTLNYTDMNLPNLTTGYYYLDITNGSGRIITSPIWYTRADNTVILPIKLGSFAVQKFDNSAKISWTTEQEINTKNFVVERSADGRTWYSILTLPAAGNSSARLNYSIYDNSPMNGINYYRLKEIDNNGAYNYSSIGKAVFANNYTIQVLPNPATDFINIYLNKTNAQQFNIELINVEGKLIYKTISNETKVQINTRGISKGLYFVKIIDKENTTTAKVLVQ